MLRKIGIGVVLILALAGVFYISSVQAEEEKPAEKEAEQPEKLELTDHQKLSYAIGLDVGKNLKQIQPPLDVQYLSMGIADKMTGQKELIPPKEVQRVQQEFIAKMRAKQAEAQGAEAKANLEEGLKFLEENKKKEGIKTTASGLQYKVLKAGTGPMPGPNDTVSVHYRGTLINGTEFDSSFKRNKPATFRVTGVIKGWTEALQLMQVGSKLQLFIPSELAYGPRGAGGSIGPNCVLIFEVELLEIKGK